MSGRTHNELVCVRLGCICLALLMAVISKMSASELLAACPLHGSLNNSSTLLTGQLLFQQPAHATDDHCKGWSLCGLLHKHLTARSATAPAGSCPSRHAQR